MPEILGRRHRELACGTCGACWRSPARFCGRCGAALVPARRPTVRRARPLAARAALAVLGLVSVAGLTAGLQAAGSLAEWRPPAHEVELPATVPEGRGLTGEEAAAALAPFGPDRLHCRPVGCERWWAEGAVAQATPARSGSDLVVVIDDRLATIDLRTGAERWAVPLTQVRPAAETGWELRPEELLLTADADGVAAWAPRGFVQVRAADGTERWSVTLTDTRRLWSVDLTDDRLLITAAMNSGAGPIEVVSAHDRDHGTVRWRQRVRWVYASGPEGTLVRSRDDRVVQLDPATGREAFALDVDEPRWVRAIGGYYVARADARTVLLFDPGSGDLVRAVEDVAAVADLQDGAGGIALLVSGRYGDDEATRPAHLVALGADGRVRWERTLGCCPRLTTAPAGTVAVRLTGAGPPLVFAAEDGTELAPPAWEPARELEWLDRDLLFASGSQAALVLDRAGSRIVLDGERPRVVNVEPLVVAASDGLLGVERRAAAAPPTEDGGPAPDVDGLRLGQHRAAALQAPALRRR
jgi:outer membrane protein assembly factor BamB